MIQVGPMNVLKFDDLPHLTKILLGQVPLATSWVDRAATDTTRNYFFSDQSAFVEGVTQGIHGTTLVYLPGVDVRADVRALMALGLPEVERMVENNAQDAPSEAGPEGKAEQERPLEKWGWANQAELASVPEFLRVLGVPATTFSSPLGLDDALAIHSLAVDWQSREPEDALFEPSPAQRAAVDFAGTLSLCAREFVQSARAHLLASSKGGECKSADIDSFLTRSAEELYDCLDAMAVTGSPDPDVIMATLIKFSDAGSRLGFSSPAAGLLQLLTYTDFGPKSDQPTGAVARGYLAAAQAMARAQTSLVPRWAQHGRSCMFTARSSTHVSISRYDFDGGLTIAGYCKVGGADVSSNPSR